MFTVDVKQQYNNNNNKSLISQMQLSSVHFIDSVELWPAEGNLL